MLSYLIYPLPQPANVVIVDLPRHSLLPPYLHLSVPSTPLVRPNATRRQPPPARRDEAFPLTKLEFDYGENGGELHLRIASTSACPIELLSFSCLLRHPESHRAHKVRSPSHIPVSYSRYTPTHSMSHSTSAVETYSSTLGMWTQTQGLRTSSRKLVCIAYRCSERLARPLGHNLPHWQSHPASIPKSEGELQLLLNSLVHHVQGSAQTRCEVEERKGSGWRVGESIQRHPAYTEWPARTLPNVNLAIREPFPRPFPIEDRTPQTSAPNVVPECGTSVTRGSRGLAPPFDSSHSRSFPNLRGIASSVLTAIPDRHTHPRSNLVKPLLDGFSCYPAPHQHAHPDASILLKIAIPLILYPRPGTRLLSLPLRCPWNQWMTAVLSEAKISRTLLASSLGQGGV
ncbi:hypothetical protein NMY22_g12033 [Coprinellus aureogranulatus]|nr:hypothetical protein NMY22_g12033 [Coprinellus aureogranulatus]